MKGLKAPTDLRARFATDPARKQDLLTVADLIAQPHSDAEAIHRIGTEAHANAPWRQIAVE